MLIKIYEKQNTIHVRTWAYIISRFYVSSGFQGLFGGHVRPCFYRISSRPGWRDQIFRATHTKIIARNCIWWKVIWERAGKTIVRKWNWTVIFYNGLSVAGRFTTKFAIFPRINHARLRIVQSKYELVIFRILERLSRCYVESLCDIFAVSVYERRNLWMTNVLDVSFIKFDSKLLIYGCVLLFFSLCVFSAKIS